MCLHRTSIWSCKTNHDLKTLKYPVRASPETHAVYLRARQNILTRVALDEVCKRKFDGTIPAPLIEVRGKSGIARELTVLTLALKELWFPSLGNQKPISLHVEHCRAILYLEDIVRWDRAGVYRELPPNGSQYWVDRHHYHTLYIVDTDRVGNQ